MRLSELTKDFLEYLEVERGHSEHTIANYGRYLAKFMKFSGDIAPADINLDLIRSYRLALARTATPSGERLTRLTQNYYMIALRGLLRYLARRDIATLSPEKIELADANRAEVSFLEIEEVERLIQAISDEGDPFAQARDRAIVEILFSTGLRVAELTGLNRDQINISRGEFAVRGKGGKDRVVFLSEQARGALASYLEQRRDDSEALFVHRPKKKEAISDKDLRLTPRSIQRIIKKYARSAGLVKKVTPHTLRHSYATDLLINGADLRSVQALLGHSSISTTQVYTHVTNKQLREVHQAFHHRRRGKS